MGLVTWIRGSAHGVEPSVSAVALLHVAHGLGTTGGPKEQFLAELGVAEDELADPRRRVAYRDFMPFVQRARELSAEAPLALAVGFGSSVSRFGSIGFAAMTSANLREAISVTERFSPLFSTAARFQLHVENGIASLELEEVCPLGPARDFIIPSLVIALWRIAQHLTGQPCPGDAEFAFPEPAYAHHYTSLAPGRVRFDQPRHRLLFDAALLDLPLVTADLSAARMTRAQCEQELSELDSAASLVSRASEALFAADGGRVRNPREIARQLGFSERTLKRKLAEQGTSYSELLERKRHREALVLLRSAASVDEVADRLGYSDAANFTRAFRRWTGRSPRALRQSDQ